MCCNILNSYTGSKDEIQVLQLSSAITFLFFFITILTKQASFPSCFIDKETKEGKRNTQVIKTTSGFKLKFVCVQINLGYVFFSPQQKLEATDAFPRDGFDKSISSVLAQALVNLVVLRKNIKGNK